MQRSKFYFFDIGIKRALEVDLVVDRPGQPTALLEIKSASWVDDTEVSKLSRFQADVKNSEAMILSNEKKARVVGNVTVFPWQEGIRKLFAQKIELLL